MGAFHPCRYTYRRLVLHTAAILAASLLASTLLEMPDAFATPGVAAGVDRPSGFYYGTDSYAPLARGSAYPFTEPRTGGLYGSYVGEIGTWTDWLGCTRGYALNLHDVTSANADEADGAIPGVSFYWFAAGPGADPHYNRKYGEAYHWGVEQAERVKSDYGAFVSRGIVTQTSYTPLMFMDIESQPFAGYGNGWNEIVNHCGKITRKAVIPTNLDRATFNGFTDYLHYDTIFHPAVYSIPSFWTETFGTGSASRIPNTDEWTPETSTRAANPPPVSFTQRDESAQWFGGVATAHQLGWQWTQNGGDFDQWDAARMP
jgi:hypothetical protein